MEKNFKPQTLIFGAIHKVKMFNILLHARSYDLWLLLFRYIQNQKWTKKKTNKKKILCSLLFILTKK